MGGMARCVLDPRTNQWVAWWDLVTTLALLFTALVTPVEVAFLQAPNNWAERLASPLFWTNRCIDVIFIADMILQFFLAYKTQNTEDSQKEPGVVVLFDRSSGRSELWASYARARFEGGAKR